MKELALAVYKGRPALVTGIGDKIELRLADGSTIRVREKDIGIIHPGPLRELWGTPPGGVPGEGSSLQEVWELLSEEAAPQGASPQGINLQSLAELIWGDFSPRSAWQAWELLQEGRWFTGSPAAIFPRSPEDLAAGDKRREEKQREASSRAAFLEGLHRGEAVLAEADRRFLQDVEALATGRTERSRTLKDLRRAETPQEAHRLLLESGYWSPFENPYPARFGLPVHSATAPVPAPLGGPQGETRRDLSHLRAYAIDNAYSDDPDDAVSIEAAAGGCTLYVHVADPAASVLPGSPADQEARDRGATLYLPEGPARMLAGEALDHFALGLSGRSPALSFKLSLDSGGAITGVEVFPSLVQVRRLSYAEADTLLDGVSTDAGDLAALIVLAERNLARRLAAGAVTIDFPEVHITVREGLVSISPDRSYRSAAMVRECMLLAGEGALLWATDRRLAFPSVSQEAGDLPANPLPGLAGSYQLRRCMRPRQLSVRPGRHWGLGLAAYTQVTSPLRRYIDLLAHQQIRASLGAGLYAGGAPLDEDELLLRLAAGEAAASAVVQAERASRAHWTTVYLMDKIASEWDAVVLEIRAADRRGGLKAQVLIPALALETQVPLPREAAPNDQIRLVLKSVRLSECGTLFEIL
jgi:exoribonuclease-2